MPLTTPKKYSFGGCLSIKAILEMKYVNQNQIHISPGTFLIET